MCRLLLSLIASFSLLNGAAAAESISLSFNGRPLQAEVADTPSERERGLMYRTQMPTDAGMLFVFDQNQIVCMWMKNTRLPLSVAFIDEAGYIVNIENMEPQTTTIHCSALPVKYALEMNRGWFGKPDPMKLWKIEGLPKLSAPAPANPNIEAKRPSHP